MTNSKIFVPDYASTKSPERQQLDAEHQEALDDELPSGDAYNVALGTFVCSIIFLKIPEWLGTAGFVISFVAAGIAFILACIYYESQAKVAREKVGQRFRPQYEELQRKGL